MRKILVTGGTVFVSKYVAEYYVGLGDEVYVLNRNHHSQPKGTTLIEADRHALGNCLKQYEFDAILDITAYTREDVSCLLDGLSSFKNYILISSSAVYPEYLPQPFVEEEEIGSNNKHWGTYGTDKAEAEEELLKKVPSAYVLRPPYLYGAMNNVYREAFVFECAEKNRKFYLPGKGEMTLQFFHVRDLCKCIDSILRSQPAQHIFNVGNQENISIREWVRLCYEAAGKEVEYVEVDSGIEQRKYFCFYDYEYKQDVTKQSELLKDTIPLKEGLTEAYQWYKEHKDEVNRKAYIEYIDCNL